MRTPHRFTKTVLAVALAGTALTACGTATAPGGASAEASAVGAGASKTPAPKRSLPSDGLATDPDPEVRHLAVATRILDDCEPGDPAPGGPGPVEPAPEGTIPSRHPSEGAPLPLEAPEPPAGPEPAPTGTGPVEEVPLDPLDKCAGDAHAERILTAFGGTGPADYPALRKKLTGLEYPPSRIHRMPDRDGSPRARIDLRFMGNNLALEVTGTRHRVRVEPFGVPETDDVRITTVQRKRNPAAPAS
ncbi:hypothetical protein [Streptomyces sp. NPDC088752]|uniref:hypothetical protein n=1 Tax=Streptomyces sp. NPDC088752 TaxID=3154963 RepID=UPI003419664C